MDDVTHNCGLCHEVTRDPAHHTCGRTPEGTLPAHQPHKAPVPPRNCWDPRLFAGLIP